MITEDTDLTLFENMDPNEIAKVVPRNYWSIVSDFPNYDITYNHIEMAHVLLNKFCKSLIDLGIIYSDFADGVHDSKGKSLSLYELKQKFDVTIELLKNCKKVDISYVGIRIQNSKVTDWPSDEHFLDMTIYSNEVRYCRWPAIWHAVDVTEGISKSCGNGYTAQINDHGYTGFYDLTKM